ncbi:MAG: Gfo/Idh/MocA family protein [Gemmatimonadales bacterium]
MSRLSRASTVEAIHVAFLGCGYIARVHARHLRALRDEAVTSFASREPSRAERLRARFGGVRAFGSYAEALADPAVDAVVVAVPPAHHLDLALRALEAGKHVLVEKPAFVRLADYTQAIAARDAAERVAMVAENDHYKPLARTLRGLLADDAVGELLLCHFVTVADRPKPATDWRNDEELAGGDAFFEEGIHWLHFAGSLGPSIRTIHGFRPPSPANCDPDGDVRRRSMLIAFQYDTGAVGALYYSREIPSLLRGIRFSKLLGRKGVITFESNGGLVFTRGNGWPRLTLPGFADIRGYRAMYRDFLGSIREGRDPEMTLERARTDHELMDAVFETCARTGP